MPFFATACVYFCPAFCGKSFTETMTVAETTGLLQLAKSCCSKVLGWCRTETTSCEALGALLQQFADERREGGWREDADCGTSHKLWLPRYDLLQFLLSGCSAYAFLFLVLCML